MSSDNKSGDRKDLKTATIEFKLSNTDKIDFIKHISDYSIICKYSEEFSRSREVIFEPLKEHKIHLSEFQSAKNEKDLNDESDQLSRRIIILTDLELNTLYKKFKSRTKKYMTRYLSARDKLIRMLKKKEPQIIADLEKAKKTFKIPKGISLF